MATSALLFLALFARAHAATPPVFATEYSLNYIVTNEQYGFVAIGKWFVDHENSKGQLNLRERTHAGNATLHPTDVVKDYKAHMFFNVDDTMYPSSQGHACFGSLPKNLTQPAWSLPATAVNVAKRGAGYERWRVFHASQRVCVDFFVAPAHGSVPRLPFQLLYFGNCAGTTIGPAEVLAQNNSYNGFAFEDQPSSLYTPPSTAAPCDGETKQQREGEWLMTIRGDLVV